MIKKQGLLFYLVVVIVVECAIATATTSSHLDRLKVIKSKFGVIGLGSTGATVFGKLSQAGEDVIGIDIGPDLEGYPLEGTVRNLDQHKLLAFQSPFNPSEIYYKSVPQTFCYFNGTCIQKSIDLRRFHMVAGCNRHNNGLPRPGVDKFLDDWRVRGWRAREIRPYFDQVARDSRFQLLRQDRANQTKFMRRFSNAGYSLLDDSVITEETRIGISRNVFQLKQVNDSYFERVSSYDSYYGESRRAQRFGRKFSSMRADYLVPDGDRVDQQGRPIIVGVVATNLTHGTEQIYFSFEQETIVSLGAYDTITLMMRSGFGPCDELEAMNVTCLVDIPKLGKTMNDHFVLAAITNTSISEAITKPNTQFTTITAIQFADNGESYPTVIMDAFMESDIPFLPQPFFPRTVGFVVILSVKNFGPGTVTLDPTDHYKPLVDPKLFQQGWEMSHFKRMFNEYRRIMTFNQAYTNEIVPGPQVQGEEAIHNYIVDNLAHGSHPCCTAAMGNRTETDSVVDENLLVRKIARLSIADASVAKTGIHANTNWLAITIGVKASDLILERARSERRVKDYNDSYVL